MKNRLYYIVAVSSLVAFVTFLTYGCGGSSSGGSSGGSSETVSTPNTPTGTTAGTTGTSYSYSTGGASSGLGHTIQYQFDWKGDGTVLSAWGSASQSKSWSPAGGTFSIRARARCSTHTSIVSGWSSGLSVIISDITPPTVSLVNPLNNSTGVLVSGNISVTFSEAMNQATAQGAFSISPSVAGAFSWNGSSMTFDPTNNLDYTLYTCTVSTAAEDLAGNNITSQYQWGFAPVDNTTPPTVLSVSPLNNSTGVPASTNISVTFSEAMNQATAQDAFSISPSVAGAFSWSSNTMTFNPTGYLAFNTLYTCTVSIAAEDLAGNNMANQYQWSFTTAAPDIIAATVLSVSPPNNSNPVPVSTDITVTFSEAMNQATAQGAFSISPAAEGAFSWSSTIEADPPLAENTVIFNPTGNLAYNTLYTCTVSTAAEDLAGNNMASQYQWSFTTAAPDTTRPTVLSVSPNSDGVSVSTNISVTFSEPMSQTTVQGAFSISPTVAGAFFWNVNGDTMIFDPTNNLAGTIYTCTISTAAEDLAGDNMASQYQWGFATVVLPDTTPPTVLSVSPPNNSYPVPVSTDITVTFSEAMNQATAQGAFSISPTAVGAFSWSSSNTMTFNPTGNLAANTIYTCGVSPAAEDLAGNNITSQYQWSFETGPPPPSTAVDNYCWVANNGSNNVTRILKSNSAITTTITVGTWPTGVAVDETYCWVANEGGGVTRILKADLSTALIDAGYSPRGVAVDETYCWVANASSNNVTRITKSTLATTTITVISAPRGVAVDETYCWVANSYYNNVTRIIKSTLATTTITVGTWPIGVAVDKTYCWVSNNGSANVTRIVKSTLATTTIAVGTASLGVAVDETYCWVANETSNNVTRIVKSTLATTTIVVGSSPQGVAVDATYCWVTNVGSNVTRIVKSTLATTTIRVGSAPYSLGDMTGYAYDNYSRVP
ncbi:MAG: Ig-like domain-containing protein [Planctomycetota bacterium]